MPIYVYLCDSCKQTIEELQKFSDPPLTKCPSCDGTLKKQFSSEFGLSFKGSGFYITDYKNKPADKDKGSSDSKTAKDGAKKETGTKKKKEKSTTSEKA